MWEIRKAIGVCFYSIRYPVGRAVHEATAPCGLRPLPCHHYLIVKLWVAHCQTQPWSRILNVGLKASYYQCLFMAIHKFFFKTKRAQKSSKFQNAALSNFGLPKCLNIILGQVLF